MSNIIFSILDFCFKNKKVLLLPKFSNSNISFKNITEKQVMTALIKGT